MVDVSRINNDYSCQINLLFIRSGGNRGRTPANTPNFENQRKWEKFTNKNFRIEYQYVTSGLFSPSVILTYE